MASKSGFERSLFLAGLILGSAVLLPSPASAQVEESSVEEVQSLITTDGYGEVRVAPDSLRVSVGAEAQAATLEEARAEVNRRMQSLIPALRGLNLPRMTLETQSLQFYPVYDDGTPPSIVGYHVSNRVTLTLRAADPALLGEQAALIVDTSLNAEANVIGGLDFFLDDPAIARAEALRLAVDDARRDAIAVAEAAGVSLAGLHSITESPASGASVLVMEASRYADGGSETQVEIGEIVVSSVVAVQFRFAETPQQ